jgi:hypothetical protein
MPKKTLALLCGVSVVFAAHPYTIAGSPAPAMIGTMTAVGTADVRGVKTREATLFSGDVVRSLDRSYVKVFLNGGHRIELSFNTDVKVSREGDLTKVAMASGMVGFSSAPAEALQLDVQSLTVLAGKGNSGSVSSLSANLVSVAAVTGEIRVRNKETGESFSVHPGTSSIFGLRGREPASRSIALTAAAARPARPQQQAAPRQQQPPAEPPAQQEPATVRIPPPPAGSSAGSGMSTSTKVLIVAGVGGGIGVIAAVAGGNKNVASPSTP